MASGDPVSFETTPDEWTLLPDVLELEIDEDDTSIIHILPTTEDRE